MIKSKGSRAMERTSPSWAPPTDRPLFDMMKAFDARRHRDHLRVYLHPSHDAFWLVRASFKSAVVHAYFRKLISWDRVAINMAKRRRNSASLWGSCSSA